MLVFLLSLAPLSSIQAKKPIHTEPGNVLLSGSVWADDGLVPAGSADTFNVTVKSGKETTVTIVVRHFMFTAEFAQSVDFISNKYDNPDGLTCFAVSDWASGAYTLYEDGSADFGTFPEFLTADGEAIQKYEFFLSGTHNFDLANEEFPAEGPITVDLEFDRVEIGTEGKGQNRRRSCTGVFPSEDHPDVDFSAIASFARE